MMGMTANTNRPHGKALPDAQVELAKKVFEQLEKKLGSQTKVADALGSNASAVLVAPRSSFRAKLREHGPNLPRLAYEFGSNQSLVALRIGETYRPVALVQPHAVVTRAAQDYLWPGDPTLRKWAHVAPGPGVKRTVVSDARRTVLLSVIDGAA